MKTILATAYAINPYKGSEDAMGWNYVTQIARFNKVIAVTRENNEEDINRYITENPNPIFDNIEFVYHDLPYYMRFWKKGERGALVYFYMWQRSVPQKIKRLNLIFDIVHNLNFHNDWTPSWLYKLNKPMVWGPVGHHPKIPKAFIKPIYGNKAYYRDRATWLVKKTFWNLGYFINKTARKSDKIICMNSSVQEVLNIPDRKVIQVNSVCAEPATIERQKSDKFTLLFVGRFVPLKGADVAIEAFAQFYRGLSSEEQENVEFLLIGKGPEEEHLKQLATSLGLTKGIAFIPWMERSKLTELYARASLFFFPSHEGAGMVVPEALAYGIPIITFDNIGPGEFINDSCGIRIPYLSYARSVEKFKLAAIKMYRDPKLFERLSKGALSQYEERFSWDKRGKLLTDIYQSL